MEIAVPPPYDGTGYRRIIDAEGNQLHGRMALELGEGFTVTDEPATPTLPARTKVVYGQPDRSVDHVFHAGVDVNSDPDPHDHVVGTRFTHQETQYPWATSVALVLNLERISGVGDFVFTLTRASDDTDLVTLDLGPAQTPTDETHEFMVTDDACLVDGAEYDVGMPISAAIVGAGAVVLTVYNYAQDTSSVRITYAALRFMA